MCFKKKEKKLSLRYKGYPKTYAGFLLWELSIPNSAQIARAIPNRTLVIPNFGVHVHQNRVFGPNRDFWPFLTISAVLGRFGVLYVHSRHRRARKFFRRFQPILEPIPKNGETCF